MQIGDRNRTGIVAKRGIYVAMLSAALLLAGCGGGFFTKPGSGTGGGGGSTSGSSTADYLYVVNQGSNTLSEFSVSSGKLGVITGSPLTLPANLAPTSVTVTRPNTFVYVGGAGAIFCYSIQTDGSLKQVMNGGTTASANFVSLDTSPDGQWLLALDSLNNGVSVYAINTSTGALSLNTTVLYAVPGHGAVNPTSLRLSPNASVVIATLGTGGDAVFTFDTTKGALTTAGGLALTGLSDNAVAFDAKSAYAYIARGSTTGGTNGVASYSISANGALTSVQALALSGPVPFAIVLDSTDAFAYVANRGVSSTTNNSTITGYSVANGTLTPLADSPFSAAPRVTALTLDQSGNYLVAVASGGTNDVTLYGEDALAAGKLDALSISASGSIPIAVAATH